MLSAVPDRKAFHQGINGYVPGMTYASNVNFGEPSPFTLGKPATQSATAIATGITSNAVANTEVSISWLADANYGRSIVVSPAADPGAGGILDVYGFDYLGQPMVERFTFTSGSTAVLYGKKAFYRIYKSKIVGASANATTYRIGTGFRLGLPYKGDVGWAKEGGILVPLYKRDTWFWFDRSAADAAAGISKWLRAPFAGFVKTLSGTPDGGGSTTDPVITVELGGTAVTGLTVTVDTSDVTGLTVTDTPTTVGYSANNRFRPNDLIEVVGAAATGAKGDRLGLELTPTHFLLPDLTDPQTTTTSDPRGVYEPLTAPDGSTEYVVGLVGDPSTNAAGNGGLHGIRHAVS